MKAYTYTLAPVIADFITLSGYDAEKLTQAIESNGNDNLRVVESASRTAHRFTPERVGVRLTKPASSAATVNHTVRMEGKGNLPEQFAAWADSTVKLIKAHGTLTAIPLPVTLKTWLDAKFKADSAKTAPRTGLMLAAMTS